MVCLNFTLLIIEDSIENATIYQNYLRSKGCRYNLSIVASIAEGLELCHTSSFDAVLLGCSVSSADALNFLESLAQPSECARPAIVIVATENDARTAVRALKLGAQDYLLERDLNPELLQSAIASAIEKAHLETQLLESDDRLRLTIEAAKLGTVDFNLLTGQVIWNATAEVFMGYVPGAAATYTYADFEARVHPDDRANVSADLARVTIDLPDSTSEFRTILPDESIRWLRAFGRFYYDDGRAVRMLGTIEDITEARQAELNFRRSEEFNRRILENNQDCIKVLDLDGRLVYMNDGGQKLLEIANFADYDRSLWTQFWGGSEQELAQAAFVAAKAGTVSKFEGQCSTVTGVPKWWQVSVIPLHDADGNVEQILSISHDLTERVRSELAIKESEDLFRTTFERAGVGICHVELSGRWMLVNPKLCDFLGYSEAELLATSFQAITHSEDLGTDLEYVRRLINGDIETYTMEKRYIHQLGHSVWANLTVSLRLSDTGAPRHFISVVEDIHARKQAELALLESERKFSAIFNQTFEFIGLLSLDGVLLEVNQAALDSVGTSRTEIVGKNFWETQWWTHSHELQQQLRTSIARTAQGEFICYEVSFPAANGEMMTTNFSLKPVYDECGRVTTLVAEGYDITDLKRTEAALLASEERFRSTFEQAAVGIAHVDLAGRVLMCNDKLCDIFGYTAAELLDKKFQDLTHPDDMALNLAYFSQLLAGEIATYSIEKRYIHQLGHIIWANLTVSLRRDASGVPLHVISIVEDIDDRKQIEFDLHTQKAELAKTTALLELRNQELNRFSHTVSHDLKAPLRGISNLTAWIREDLSATVDPGIIANLDLMRSRVSRMETLINGLLDYAKVGNTATSLETFAVEDLLAEIVDSLSIPDSFVVELPSELPPITTNRVLLSQVLANLMGNAYKHHDRIDGQIRVTAELQGESWEFAVIDDGPGIAPENHARVFDMFQTLSSPDKGNSGIGLAIVKKIVEAQGGNISIASQLGVGTTFQFTWKTEPTD